MESCKICKVVLVSNKHISGKVYYEGEDRAAALTSYASVVETMSTLDEVKEDKTIGQDGNGCYMMITARCSAIRANVTICLR